MRKPLFTRPIILKSRSNLARSLQWYLQKRFLAEIGPLRYQLDQLEERVGFDAAFTQRRTLSISDELHQVDKILHKELRTISIAYAIALLTVSLGSLIGFFIN